MDIDLKTVIDSLENSSGQEFFNKIVLSLSSVIKSDYVFIARLNITTRVSTTIALCDKSGILKNFNYALKDTPCSDVAENSICCYPSGVTHLYPKDELLIDMQIEGYLGVPLHDSKGDVLGLIVILSKLPIDDEEKIITLFKIFSGRIAVEIERSEQEKELRDSEMRLNLAITGTNDGLWDWKLDTNEVYYSPTWFEMLGHLPDNFPKTLDTWEQLVNPDDKERVLQHITEYLDGHIDNLEMEFRMKHKDGHWVNVLSRGKFLTDGEGEIVKPFRLVGTHVDITEKTLLSKQLESLNKSLEMQIEERTKELQDAKELAENAKNQTDKAMERFNTAMLATEDGIWDWNIVTSEVYYSPAWQTMLGYGVGELAQTLESWTKILHPDDLDMAMNHAGKFINNESDEYRMEFRMLCKDGSYKWVLARAKDAQRDENGKVTRIIGTHVDIQGKKEIELELIQAKEDAEAASVVKSDFLANMSHEIRTPMNAIIGMTYLALETDLNDKQKNYVSKAHSSAESLLGIINDILDLSKIEAGKLELEEIDFELKDVIKKMVELVQLKAKEKDLNINVKIEKDVPKHFLGDPLRLGQVLINLASNAVKFSKAKGSIWLNIALISEINDSYEVQFTVRDEGIGMSEEAQTILFQPFSQADSSTTRKYAGTGLGLTISKSISEQMGGKIWAKSEDNLGSMFGFTVLL